MIKSKIATSFMMIGLIGLVMSCSHIEQLDHDKPVKPLPKVTDMAMVERIRHTNKVWFPVEKQVIEIATD